MSKLMILNEIPLSQFMIFCKQNKTRSEPLIRESFLMKCKHIITLFLKWDFASKNIPLNIVILIPGLQLILIVN